MYAVYLMYMLCYIQRNMACEEHHDDLVELERVERSEMVKLKETKETETRLQLLHVSIIQIQWNPS